MAIDCNLSGIIKGLGCSPGGIQKPIEANVLSPFVKVKFASGNLEITVGNEPSPSVDNMAIIKSFDYDASDGMLMTIEIIDQQGGGFSQLMRSMVKCLSQVDTRATMIAEWGWIALKCDGSSEPIKSEPVTVYVQEIKTQVTKGYHKYLVQGCDLSTIQGVTRSDVIIGEQTEEGAIGIKEAILKFLKEHGVKYDADPPIRFLRHLDDDETKEWDFKEKESIKKTWHSNGLSPVEVVREWTSGYLTDASKGMYLTTGEKPNQLIMWEESTTKTSCGKQETYIVNGGGCSRVIEFQPEINWLGAILADISTGGGEPSTSSEPVHLEDQDIAPKEIEGCQPKEAGSQTTSSQKQNDTEDRSAKEAAKEGTKNRLKNIKSNPIAAAAIEAQLVIQGDPRKKFVHIFGAIGQEIAIAIVNPFGIQKNGEGICKWLAQPSLNEVLTNKHWRIQGVSHSIREGSYTTTLKVNLAAAGIDIDINQGLGGDGFNVNS